MEKKDDHLKKIILFIFISLLLHLGLVVFFYKMHAPRGNPNLFPESPQEVIFVRPEDIVPAPPQGGSAEQLELADIAKPKIEKVPEKARFKSQYNSTVKDETVAKQVPKKARLDAETSDEDGKKGDNADIPGPKNQEKPKKVAMQEKLKEKPLSETPAEETKKEIEKEPEKDLSLKDLELKPTDFKDLLKEKKSSEKKEDTATSQNRLLKDKEFASLPSSYGKPGLPGAGDFFAHDFLPNIKIGDKTYLNALAFPDVQYFARLKRIFRLRFNPAPPLRAYFSENRVVVGKVNVIMAVTVSPNGQLQELFVVRSSGIPAYDDEALRTVRQSAPFNAPPSKILDKDGTLRMTWNFVTYL